MANAKGKPENVHGKIMALRAELNDRVLERKTEIDGALIALGTKSNVFLLGEPGTGKTYLTNLLCQAIDGANYFEFLMMKGSKLEEIFGPLKLSQLENDKYIYNTENRFPTAHIAFIDEIWKCSSATGNALLKCINEHVFINDGKSEQIPLMSCFSASNELPEDSSLNAMFDRFLLRYVTKYLCEKENFKKLIRINSESPIKNRITLADIECMQKEIASIDESGIDDILSDLQDRFSENGFTFSDRRWKACVKILKAFAWLNGRDKVSIEDTENLVAVFWDNPEQIRDIQKIILTFANPRDQMVLALLDEAQNIADKAIETAKQLLANGQKAYAVGGEANEKIQELKNRLASIPDCPKKPEVMEQIKGIGRMIQAKCLGI